MQLNVIISDPLNLQSVQILGLLKDEVTFYRPFFFPDSS